MSQSQPAPTRLRTCCASLHIALLMGHCRKQPTKSLGPGSTTARYALCGREEFHALSGLAMLDPATECGVCAWNGISELIIAFFERPACWKTEVAGAEADVKACQQGSESVSEFLPKIARLMDKVRQAGGRWQVV